MGETKDNSDRFKCETGICALSKPEEVLRNILGVIGSIRWVNLFLFFHLQRQKAVATGCLERPAKSNDILGLRSSFPKYGQQIRAFKNNTFILCHNERKDIWKS